MDILKGTQWVAETHLYNVTERLFSFAKVQQHASPHWLSPQHLDIYFPEFERWDRIPG